MNTPEPLLPELPELPAPTPQIIKPLASYEKMMIVFIIGHIIAVTGFVLAMAAFAVHALAGCH